MKMFLTALLIAVTPLSSAFAANSDVQTSASTNAPQLLEGKRFTVLVEGDGPDVVLIPGLSSPRAVWGATEAQLKGRYRLHIVQIRGFGDDAGLNADGPVLESFITELADYIDDEIINKGRAAPAVIGHSMGGLSGLMLAAAIPEKIGKVMVVDAVPFIGTIFGQPDVDTIRPQAEAMAAGMRASYGKPAPAMPPMTDEQKAAASRMNSMSISATGQQQVADWSKGADARVVAQVLYDVMTTDMRPKLTEITAPISLLYAHDPELMTEAMATGAFVPQYTGTKHFTAIRVEGSRHFIMLDQPERFAAEVEKFLQ